MRSSDKIKSKFLNRLGAVFSFIWLKPQQFIRDAFSKKSLNKFIGQLYNPEQSDEIKAISAAFGVFMGIIPIWGFQTLAAIFLAVTLKLNKTLVLIFSLVSFPPMMPLIIYLSYRLGRFWLNAGGSPAAFSKNISVQNIGRHLEQYVCGSITLAVIAGILIGLLTLILLKTVKIVRQYKLSAALKQD